MMIIKLKRASRTFHSEEITIQFSDDQHLNGDLVDIGKLDVHYLGDQIVGTLLIWQEHANAFSQTGSGIDLDEVIDEILTEMSAPIGVPSEYGIEIYYPSLAKQDFISNYADEEQEQPQQNASGGGEEPEAGDADEQLVYEGPLEDDFAKQLRSRPDES
jgi:hypothetical protein